MSEPLKSWESFETQLARLKSRGLLVDDDRRALHYLATVGYYRLSGYWYPLRAKIDRRILTRATSERASTFVPGSRFEAVVRLYLFDRKLRLLALDALERIEMAVRVDVAYLLGERDPLAHENPTCLHGDFAKKVLRKNDGSWKTLHEDWMEAYRERLRRARRELFVAHHRKKYGKLPIWVAIEVWDFGMLSRLFSGMRVADKNRIAIKYGAKDGEAFAQWLRSLNYIRNVCAHHSRLWNLNITAPSPLPARWPHTLDNTRPFLYFCLMQHLLRTISPGSNWHERFKDILTQDFPGRKFSLGDFGLLPGWDKWPLWQQAMAQKYRT